MKFMWKCILLPGEKKGNHFCVALSGQWGLESYGKSYAGKRQNHEMRLSTQTAKMQESGGTVILSKSWLCVQQKEVSNPSPGHTIQMLAVSLYW